MNSKSILLAYATRFGSTQEVAEAITATLREAGIEVELQAMQDVESLDGYDAIVLGAALYNTRWHQAAHQFLTKHKESLMQRPVAIFTLGPLNTSDAAKRNSRRQLDKELGKYAWLKPVALEVFAGKYDPSKPGMGFFERLLPARDYRDWEAMRAWANALPTQLEQAETLQMA
jgi:menaquinone-dependent protoporphyrinogen oxidase